jgi:predicted flap endonuclease-1-like 5' DNA nuclease
MFRKLGIFFSLLAGSLTLTGFSGPLAGAAEDSGNPWWIWLLVLLALVVFAGVIIWWWMGTHGKEEVPPATRGQMVAPEPPAEPLQPDDLKRIEGIGPKISGVLQAAGIATFAQLAATDVSRIRQILEEENPNLLRLANPATWPEQAQLAAAGEWEALEVLQDELKGGRRV